jgi:hypothetical protein
MNNTIEQGKTAAITSYILGIGVFIAMSMNADDKNTFCLISHPTRIGINTNFYFIGINYT